MSLPKTTFICTFIAIIYLKLRSVKSLSTMKRKKKKEQNDACDSDFYILAMALLH